MNDLILRRLDAILAEIDAIDCASAGAFRQASDREAFNVAARIERKMQQNQGKTERAAHEIR